jgi:hypothetical protein
MNLRLKSNVKPERGQALAEYVVLFPIAIAILLVAGTLTDMIIDSFSRTTVGLETRHVVSCEQDEPAEKEGPTHADLDCHTIDLVSDYTADGKTYISYKVSSNCDPSISHWTLAMSSDVFALVEGASEMYEYGTDPTTGVTGIKFDTGYESDGDSGKPPKDDGDDGDKGKGKPPKDDGDDGDKGKGKPPKKTRSTLPERSNLLSPSSSDTRTVLITLAGTVEWDEQIVAIKAGTHTYYSTISAPIVVVEEDPSCLQ